MRKTGLIGFAALAMLLGACSPSGGELTGKVWTFSSVKANRPSAGEAMADPNNPWTIEFRDDGTFNALAECNVTRGTYETTSTGGLTLHPGDTTYEGCPSSPMRNMFAPVIARATSFEIADGTLRVTVEGGSVISFEVIDDEVYRARPDVRQTLEAYAAAMRGKEVLGILVIVSVVLLGAYVLWGQAAGLTCTAGPQVGDHCTVSPAISGSALPTSHG